MRITDFTMTAGDTKVLSVTVTEKSDGSATDITGAVIAWKIAQSLRGGVLLSKSTPADITITSGTGGIFAITVDPADTASLLGDYYHEAQVTFSTGEISTVLKGKMTVEPGLI